MRALILAAGRGSRMKGLTDERPKGLVELCGRSLVERMVDSLHLAGVYDIGIVTGYRRESFDFLELPTFHNPRWAETNMVMSLACAADWLRRDSVMVCYSDIFTAPDTLKKLSVAPHDLAITYDRQWARLWADRFPDVLSDAESFRIEKDRIVEIGNKAARIEDIQGQYMGLFKLTPASWAKIESILAGLPPERAAKLSVTPVLQLLIESGYPLHGVPVDGQWGEVDQGEDLAVYERYASEGRFGAWFSVEKSRKTA